MPKKPNLYHNENFITTGSGSSMSNFSLNHFLAVDEYDSNLKYIKWRAIKQGTTSDFAMRVVIYAAKNPSTTLNVNHHQAIDPQTFRVFYDSNSAPNAKGYNQQQAIVNLKSMLTEANTSNITKGVLRMGIFCAENVEVGYTLAHTAKV